MKVAFTASGDDLKAPLDTRFGRAPKFIIYDLEQNTFSVIDNSSNQDAAQGAGVQAAETVARAGVGAIVTGHCGPRAFQVLGAAGVKVYTCSAPTVAAALEEFRAGKLTPASGADVGSHWS